jgi:hypothetical protein
MGAVHCRRANRSGRRNISLSQEDFAVWGERYLDTGRRDRERASAAVKVPRI